MQRVRPENRALLGFLIFHFFPVRLFSFWQRCARLAPLQTFRQSDPLPPSSKQIHSINLQKNTQLKLYTCKNKKEKSLESFSKAVRPLGGVSSRQQESCYILKRWPLKKDCELRKTAFFYQPNGGGSIGGGWRPPPAGRPVDGVKSAPPAVWGQPWCAFVNTVFQIYVVLSSLNLTRTLQRQKRYIKKLIFLFFTIILFCRNGTSFDYAYQANM